MNQVSNCHINDYELFEVGERLDLGQSDDLNLRVIDSLDNNCQNFLFNFNNLLYISSYAIRIFVKLIRANKKVSIVVHSESVFKIFEMGALVGVLNVKRNLNDAIKIFTQTKI